MQTFLPYADFKKSAECLDRARLGKQRVEAYQILCSLLKPDYGWKNHPAVKMWKGCEVSLFSYAYTIVNEWQNRGYQDSMYGKLQDFQASLQGESITSLEPPSWLGNERFHSAHRAALLAKDFAHYSQFGWKEEPKLDYFWPV